jgi:Helix-turn-helix domain
MLIVGAEVALVEAELVGGRLGCPSCRAVLGPWGFARERVLRCRAGDRVLRPRRARCRGCAGTHVLLPEIALARRQDEVAVIGAAIEAKIAGEGFRRIAERLGACPETVRGWLRRFAGRVELIRAHFTRCAVVLDPELGSCCRPGAASRTRWKRSRLLSGRGCCGSGRLSRGSSSRGCRAGCCCNTNRPLEGGF